MNKGIIKYLKNSIDEKGNYCYSLPVETTKAVIKELNRLNNIIKELSKDVDMWNKKYNEQFNIITELEKWLEEESKYDEYVDLFYREHMGSVLEILKKLKENNK